MVLMLTFGLTGLLCLSVFITQHPTGKARIQNKDTKFKGMCGTGGI